MRPVPETPVKKPYEPPKLTIYGDLAQMTSARFMGSGSFDGTKGRKT
jgi:hypothetical protein